MHQAHTAIHIVSHVVNYTVTRNDITPRFRASPSCTGNIHAFTLHTIYGWNDSYHLNANLFHVLSAWIWLAFAELSTYIHLERVCDAPQV